MGDYEYTEDMSEVSGLGGEYEEACRKMVIAGAQWLDENGKSANEDYDADEELKRVMADAVDDVPTGAMMHGAFRHVSYIDRHGWEAYVEKMESDD